jgi:4-hydroxy-tetrahydrodipicolinate reductase
VPLLTRVPERGTSGEVVVDFSRPAGLSILAKALRGSGLPLVSGTTGIGGKERELLQTYSEESPVFYDENMSYGISLLKRLLAVASAAMGNATDVEIVEFHHRGKADFPSGTADAIARSVRPQRTTVPGRGDFAGPDPERVHIHSVRLGGVAGEHQVHLASADETLTLSHRALSREVFARGAVRAARFVSGRKSGFFTMDDLAEEGGNG